MSNKPRPLTPERRAEIDRALEETGGVRTRAAKILKTKHGTLKNYLERDTILRAKWIGTEEDTDPTIHTPAVGHEERTALSFAKEETNLAKGLGSLGFDLNETEKLVQLANFANGGRMEKITDLTSGGMARNTARLLLLFDRTYQKIEEISEDPSKFHEYEDGPNGGQKIAYSGWKKLKEMMNTLLEIAKETRNTNDAAQESIIQRAKIEEIKKRLKEEAKSPNKIPGFGGPPEVFGNPTLIQNNYGSGKKEKPAGGTNE